MVAALTDAGLDEFPPVSPAPEWGEESHSVRPCLDVMMDEDCEHRRFAVRDLAVLEARSVHPARAEGRDAGPGGFPARSLDWAQLNRGTATGRGVARRATESFIGESGGAPSSGRALVVLVGADADDALHAGGQHAPLDQPRGQLVGAHVVDDRQRLEVLGADRQHLAVVVVPLGLDGRGVAGQRAGLVGGQRAQRLRFSTILVFVVTAELGRGSGSSSETGTP